jgi:hypothetical protein
MKLILKWTLVDMMDTWKYTTMITLFMCIKKKMNETKVYVSLYLTGRDSQNYCRLALGNRVVDRDSYARQRTRTTTSSSTRNSHAAGTVAVKERERQCDEAVQNLMQMNQYILGILHVSVLYMFNLSNSI